MSQARSWSMLMGRRDRARAMGTEPNRKGVREKPIEHEIRIPVPAREIN